MLLLMLGCLSILLTPEDRRLRNENNANGPFGNSIPVIENISFTPSSIYTNDTIQAVIEVTDPENDTVSFTYEWFLDDGAAGTLLQQGDQGTLDGSLFQKGDQIYVVVTPFDGTDYGLPRSSLEDTSITIQNSLPSAPIISVSPEDPTVRRDDLKCTIEVGSSDDDGDPIEYTFEWYDASNTLMQSHVTNSEATNVYSGSETTTGTWSCLVTPSDDEDSGSATEVFTEVVEGCRSLEFDGFNDIATVDQMRNYDFGSEATFELWMWPTELINSSATQSLFFLGSQSPPPAYALSLQTQDSSSYEASVNSEEASYATRASIVPEAWNHLSVVFNNGTLSFYLNGTLAEPSVSTTQSALITTDNPLSIGSIAGMVEDFGWNGVINSVRISDVARYTEAFSPTFEWTVDDSTVLYLEGEDASGWKDISANEWHADVTDATWTTTCPEDKDGDGLPEWEDCDDADDSVGELCCTWSDCDDLLNLGDGVGLELVLVPSGSFTMGSPPLEVGRGQLETQHDVVLSNDFYLMKTEVTQRMYNALMGDLPLDDFSDEGGQYGVGDDHPVYYVSWDMAAAFANAATQQYNLQVQDPEDVLEECYTCGIVDDDEGSQLVCTTAVNPYACSGYRLPTEAEWEYAARAGSSNAIWTPDSADGENIPAGTGYELYSGCSDQWTLDGGSTLANFAWFCGNDRGHNTNYPGGVKSIAQLEENSFGLFDMNGNIWEWVHDYYGLFSANTAMDPVQEIGEFRIIRGGSWTTPPKTLRSAHRENIIGSSQEYFIGLRLARSATSTQ